MLTPSACPRPLSVAHFVDLAFFVDDRRVDIPLDVDGPQILLALEPVPGDHVPAPLEPHERIAEYLLLRVVPDAGCPSRARRHPPTSPRRARRRACRASPRSTRPPRKRESSATFPVSSKNRIVGRSSTMSCLSLNRLALGAVSFQRTSPLSVSCVTKSANTSSGVRPLSKVMLSVGSFAHPAATRSPRQESTRILVNRFIDLFLLRRSPATGRGTRPIASDRTVSAPRPLSNIFS